MFAQHDNQDPSAALRAARRATLAALLIAVPVAAQRAEPTYTIQKADGYVAHVHRPAGNTRAPVVMLVGGSGGGIGWQDYMADLLAKRGIVGVAVGYFSYDSLPKDLERIPVEVFDRALAWVAKLPYVDRNRIGIGGVSKGSELALLLASMHPEIHAVAVFAPSAVVWQSIAPGYPKTSSWTLRGADVPYVPYGSVKAPKNTAEIYRAGLEHARLTDSLDRATIQAEKINGPVLLLSGRDDTLWPSPDMSAMIVERLRAHAFRFGVDEVVYEHAGHLISSIRDDDVTVRGGTKEGNDAAQRAGQVRFLEFFGKALAGR